MHDAIAANKTKTRLRVVGSMHTLQPGGKFSRGVTLNPGTHRSSENFIAVPGTAILI